MSIEAYVLMQPKVALYRKMEYPCEGPYNGQWLDILSSKANAEFTPSRTIQPIEDGWNSEEFINRAKQKIAVIGKLLELEDNWDSYGSEAPCPKALKKSVEFLKELIPVLTLPNQISPSPDGGVMFEFRRANRYYLVSILNEGDIVYLTRTGDEKATAVEVTEDKFKAIAARIAYGL